MDKFVTRSSTYDGTRVVCMRMENKVVVQPYDVYIGREEKRGGWNLEASIFANKDYLSNEEYRKQVLANPFLVSQLHTLKGKVLGCWCKTTRKNTIRCHGDVLVALVRELR
jgi:hypothetical protein